MAMRQHSHSINLTVTGGKHQHLTAIAATGTGSDEWTGFEGNCGGDWSDDGYSRELEGYVIEPTIKDDSDYDTITAKSDTYSRYKDNKGSYYGEHNHSISGATGNEGNDYSTTELKKDLLPPYVVVYMWRRTD